jgi:ectoine hydroxylase-related dioxygenase (phytanoyl-CoA dioxygenase family)
MASNRGNLVSICPTLPNPEKWLKHIITPHLKTGDIVVWKCSIPHGMGKNVNKLGKPRMAAYINYVPAGWETENIRLDQIECFYTGKHPKGHRDDGVERKNHVVYDLDEDQARLMGIE